jgi:hypothetical protein
MTYIDYRRKIEFGYEEYGATDKFQGKEIYTGLPPAGMKNLLNLLTVRCAGL